MAPAIAMIPHPAARAAGIGLMASAPPAQQERAITTLNNAARLQRAVNTVNSGRVQPAPRPRTALPRLRIPNQNQAAANRQRVSRANRSQINPSGGPVGSR
jgi:hypothetical protein